MVAFLEIYAAAELSHFVEIVPRVPVSAVKFVRWYLGYGLSGRARKYRKTMSFVGIHLIHLFIRGGNGFLGTSGHRQMMNPSVMNLQHRLVLELSVGLSFDQS